MLDAGKDGKRISPRGCGLCGVRRQAKRDAALASEARLEMDTTQTQAKAASRFACRRTPYGCDRHFYRTFDALESCWVPPLDCLQTVPTPRRLKAELQIRFDQACRRGCFGLTNEKQLN